MQKKSRFLTGLLSAVMALTLFALPASAADGPAYNATIDPNATGSITIHKYEKDGEEKKLLNDVEFTVYKVASIEQSTGTTTEFKMEPVDELKKAAQKLSKDIEITNETTYENIKLIIDEALKEEAGNDQLKPAATPAKTSGVDDKAGTVTFNSLPVGVYLVVETEAPAQIVNKTANFLVSIPMVNAKGTGWEYNIVAEPKNTPVYGGITLYKYGKTAGTDANGELLSGAKFILQQYDATTNTWTTVVDYSKYKLNGTTGTATEKGILTTDTDGSINIQGLAPGTYRFVEYSAPSEYITDGKTVYTFTIASDAKGTVSAPKGSTYWVAGTENTPGHIEVVNEKPDLTKQVKTGTDGDGNDTFAKASDYKLGDTVTWKVTTNVPSTIENLKTFKITDEMSKALDFTDEQQRNVKITTAPDVSLAPEDYKFTTKAATASAGPSWELTFENSGKTKLAKAKTVTVIFDTTLNSNAVAGVTGNLNDATLDYSNAFYDENVNGDHPNPGEETITDQAVVYTFELNAVKKDGDDKTMPLSGAEFTLYQYKGNVTPVTESVLKGADSVEICKLVSNDEGQLVMKEGTYKDKKPLLNNGNYYLVETKAPTVGGKTYNLLKDPVTVELNVAYTVETKTETKKDTDGNVISTVKTVKNITFNDNSNKTGVFSVTIYNKKGFDLPTTGGFGTLLFSGIGALLVVGGIGVLMGTKKKKDNA
ncbi:SpaH/EbpB family LPXTG-anchored major pilin [uncultured Gemmiger sp.]|uniref:SpaH/EbpB family LPXTG-anchored major pilin n=1 Tax=uncultured Gemmiger sp. TaxID=1623490 RepID=UPI0025EC784A|nr:SpaH/EbpB family LPXTG-anchored major pilin [uncultured Gemmiger sp.]